MDQGKREKVEFNQGSSRPISPCHYNQVPKSMKHYCPGESNKFSLDTGSSVNIQNPKKTYAREKLEEFIKKIESEGDTLIIVDGYIFPNKYDSDYCVLLTELIEISCAKRICFLTKGRHNAQIRESVEILLRGMNINCSVAFTEKFHDRFWIMLGRRVGITTGCSLNGIGNKGTLINELSKEEVDSILDQLNEDLNKGHLSALTQ